MLLVAGLGFRAAVYQLDVVLRKQPVELRGPLSTIPSSFAAPGMEGLEPAQEWRQKDKDVPLPQPIVEELGTSIYLNREMIRRGALRNDMVALHVAYYTGLIDAVPHVPERCWVAAGGLTPVGTPRDMPLLIEYPEAVPSSAAPNRATGRPYRLVNVMDAISRRMEAVHLPIGDFAMRVSEYQSESNPAERILGGYCFIANGRITSSAAGVRALAFQPSERHAYFCKIQLAMTFPASDEIRWDRFQRLASELVGQMLPHLMRRLPDWPQVEAGEAG